MLYLIRLTADMFITIFWRRGVIKGVRRGVEKLTKNEKMIMELIWQNPHITKEEMINREKLTKKAVEYNIKSLKKKGIIERVGPNKGGFWRGVIKEVRRGVEKLTKNEKMIMELIRQNPHITKEEMINRGKLTKKAVEYNIKNLKKKGVIKRVGPNKGGFWKGVRRG